MVGRMTDFSLTELIESVEWDAGPAAADIARRVEPLIPENHRREVLILLLTRYIATMKPRLSTIGPEPEPEPVPVPTPGKQTNGSAKVKAYQRYAKFFHIPVNVARNTDKWMGDCTYDDLRYAANLRHQKAAETVAAAEEYELLANLVKERNVTTVKELSPADLDEFLARQRHMT